MNEQNERLSSNGQMLCPAGFPVPAGTREWELIPGPKGAKGDQGERGEQGASRLPRRLAYSLLVLFVIAAGFGVISLFWQVHETNANRAAQQRIGQVTERKLCTTLDALAALQPPAGSPASNPSRAYEQSLHATLAQLGPDIGCPAGKD